MELGRSGRTLVAAAAAPAAPGFSWEVRGLRPTGGIERTALIARVSPFAPNPRARGRAEPATSVSRATRDQAEAIPLIFPCRRFGDDPVAEPALHSPDPARARRRGGRHQRSPRSPELQRSPPRGISRKRNCRSAAQPARAGRSDRPARLAHEGFSASEHDAAPSTQLLNRGAVAHHRLAGAAPPAPSSAPRPSRARIRRE